MDGVGCSLMTWISGNLLLGCRWMRMVAVLESICDGDVPFVVPCL